MQQGSITYFQLVLINNKYKLTLNVLPFITLQLQAPMGIDGLLNFLRPVTKKEHISSFKGKTLAIDAMPWIYKGCYSCATQLNQDIQTIDFLYYILEMIDMLSYYDIKPIFVFDGRAVHAKDETLQKRIKSKVQNKAKGLEFLKNGQMEEAKKYLSRCIIIDERIISTTINALTTKNIQFYVSPYEADSQIAKLKRLGMIDGAISEDSDLVIFGVNVLLKLNHNGQCDYIDLQSNRPHQVDDSFLKFFLAFDEFNRIDAAILAGCDYNKSVKGIGIKRAVKLLAYQVTMNNVVNKLKSQINYMDKIPQDYQNKILRSKLIFCLSTVYNPFTKALQFLRPDLVDQHKPKDMTYQQLLKIVGVHYEYTQEVASGRVISKTLQKREIKTLDFPQVFRINKENMILHEVMLKKKKQQMQELKRQTSFDGQINSNPQQKDSRVFQQLRQLQKRAKNENLETEQSKEKRKEDRKNRIDRLQALMNTIVDVFDDLDSQSSFDHQNQNDQNEIQKQSPNFYESQKKQKRQFTQTKSQKEQLTQSKSQKKQFTYVKQQKKRLQNKVYAMQSEDDKQAYQQESLSQDLTFLNPFARKNIKAVTIKPQHISGSKNK